MSVVGTRPQLIKAAALQPVLRAAHQECLVDTGQHWDDELAGTFYRELGLAAADQVLGVGGGAAAEQVARMLLALEPILARERPAAVIVHGDTNSTLAGALAAASADIPVAHVEAGVRSGDRRMPEERNRIVVDHLSHWRFVPDEASMVNLRREGIEDGVTIVGDLMRDLCARLLPAIREPGALDAVARALAASSPGLALRPGRYLYATIHRAENREPAALARWTALLTGAARIERPVVLALHPGTLAVIQAAAARAGLAPPRLAPVRLVPPVHVVAPVGYRSSLALQLHAAAVITDSGGIQREATWLGTPALVVRSSTEWGALATTNGARPLLVGHDADRWQEALRSLPEGDEAEATARERAATVRIAPEGAARAIVAALAAGA